MPLCNKVFKHAILVESCQWLLQILWGGVFVLCTFLPAYAANIEISWEANREPDLAGYRLHYGDTSRQYNLGVIDVGGEIKYIFADLEEDKTYYFVVTAYDTAGNESEFSLEVFIKVPVSDKTAPAVQQARVLDLNTIEVRFSEPVSTASAESKTNYAIDQQIIINSVLLQPDTHSVKLSTSKHVEGKSYNLIIRNIADRATPANIMTAPASVSYFIENSDKTPPAVVSASALGEAKVEVIFNEPISKASAESIENFSISPSITVFAAVLQNDARRVILQTGPHAVGVNYQLTARNILDLATPPNAMPAPMTVSYSLANIDNTPPALVSVAALEASRVEIVFTERISQSSAEKIENYGISPSVAVFAATLQNDQRSVMLQTGPHVTGATYQLTVRNIADLATPSNVMQIAGVMSYGYIVEDREPPKIISVALTDLTTLLVSFDEKVTIPSAENLNNYWNGDGIQILSARLDDEGRVVRLQTTLHEYNRDYTLALSGIADVSPLANTITENLMFNYRLEEAGGEQGGNLTVNGWSPSSYKLDTLRVGATYYVDRTHTITNLPSNLNKAFLLRTAYRDRRNKSEVFMEFNLNRAAEVYIAYDGRVPEVPDWLKHNFIETSQKIPLSVSGEYMKLWRGHYLAGRVQLGGNMAPGMQYPFTISPNMYFVLIRDADAQEQPGENATPKLYEISQNYPNPMRLNSSAPRTIIACRLEQEGRVVVTVYNMLGQAVRVLYDGMLSAGTHTMAWDGRDDNLASVPSGKYLYTMEIREEMKQGDFTVTAALSRETKVMTVLK